MTLIDKEIIKEAGKLAYSDKDADFIFNFNPKDFKTHEVLELNRSIASNELKSVAYLNTRTLSLRQAIVLKYEPIFKKVTLTEQNEIDDDFAPDGEISFEFFYKSAVTTYKDYIKNRDKSKLKNSLEYTHPRFGLKDNYRQYAYLRNYDSTLLKVILMGPFFNIKKITHQNLVRIKEKVEQYRN